MRASYTACTRRKWRAGSRAWLAPISTWKTSCTTSSPRCTSGFRGEAEITTWLYRITENTVISLRRKERVRRWLRLSRLTDEPVVYPTPLDDLERVEAQCTVYRALERLSERDRAILILFELEGVSGEEIAKLTGHRLPNVWVRLHRARARFVEHAQRLDSRKRDER